MCIFNSVYYQTFKLKVHLNFLIYMNKMLTLCTYSIYYCSELYMQQYKKGRRKKEKKKKKPTSFIALRKGRIFYHNRGQNNIKVINLHSNRSMS